VRLRLVPPRRSPIWTRSVPCSLRFTGRPRPIPDDGSTGYGQGLSQGRLRQEPRRQPGLRLPQPHRHRRHHPRPARAHWPERSPSAPDQPSPAWTSSTPPAAASCSRPPPPPSPSSASPTPPGRAATDRPVRIADPAGRATRWSTPYQIVLRLPARYAMSRSRTVHLDEIIRLGLMARGAFGLLTRLLQ